jgi:hypothetical protein
VRGPLCTIIRRWGFPHAPVHPVFSPARIDVDGVVVEPDDAGGPGEVWFAGVVGRVRGVAASMDWGASAAGASLGASENGGRKNAKSFLIFLSLVTRGARWTMVVAAIHSSAGSLETSNRADGRQTARSRGQT